MYVSKAEAARNGLEHLWRRSDVPPKSKSRVYCHTAPSSAVCLRDIDLPAEIAHQLEAVDHWNLCSTAPVGK